MIVTKHNVALQIAAYLRHEISLAQLIDWAEQTLMDAELDEADVETLAAVLARLGVSDVRAFGLTWEDCEDLLRQLGYVPRVDVVAV